MIYHNTEDNITSKAYCSYITTWKPELGLSKVLMVYIPVPPKALGPKDKELWTVNDRLAIKI